MTTNQFAPRKRSLLFSKYPEVKYTVQDVEENVRNIMVRAEIAQVVRENARLFYTYDMQDGDTPEMIAHKYYDDISLHWVVLMTNLQADGRFGFGMNYNTFVNFIKSKYPGITMNANSFSGDIVVGSKIYNDTAEGVVLDWNPSVGRVVIRETVGKFEKGGQAETIIIRNDDTLTGNLQFGQTRIATDRAIHHYENTTTGDILDYAQFTDVHVDERREVSNLVYEQELNLSKRAIKLIKPTFISSIVTEMTSILKKSG